MPDYRRAKIPGGTYFFTVVVQDRSSNLLTKEIDRLRRIYLNVEKARPFKTVAICILPEHIHALWELPEGDADFSTRWNLIKGGFSRGLPASHVTVSNVSKREKAIWQRRYWEHAIRNDADLAKHVDYIHYNPVKHGYVSRVRDWPYSSFHQYVKRGQLPIDWGGDIGEIAGSFGE